MSSYWPDYYAYDQIARARKLFPNLELYWDEYNHVLSVVGVSEGGSIAQSRIELKNIRNSPYRALFQPYDTRWVTKPKPVVKPPPRPRPQQPPVPKPDQSSLTPQVERPPAPEQPAVSSWPLPGAAAAASAPKGPTKTQTAAVSVMPGRGRGRGRGRRTPRSHAFRRKQISNAALRPRRLPFRQVAPFALEQGYLQYSFTIKDLFPELLTVYEEVRVVSLSAVLLLDDAAITKGLYTAILLDQNGYGTALKSTPTWFARVADMPGSLVRHATRGCRLTWKATEPDSRNYIKVIDAADLKKPIATAYYIGRESSLAMTGVILIRGHCLVRGQYYDATKLTTAMIGQLRLKEIDEEEKDPDVGAAVESAEG